MKKEVIISTFQRDYSWITELNSDVKVTVYRKGQEPLRENEILINKNVGRDVHTFFYHFLTKYNSLSDITFTSQDYFEDHISNYHQIINGDEDMWNECALQYIHECWFFNNKCPLLISDRNGFPHHPDLPMEKYWNELFIRPCPNIFRFTPAGHFCITKEQVKKRPIKFYEKIVNILEKDYDSPWVIERLEPYIFDLNYQIKL